MTTYKSSATRTRYYRQMYAGLKQLGWKEFGPEFQSLLMYSGAKPKDDHTFSKSSLDIKGLMAVVDGLKRAGFKPNPKSASTNARQDKQGQIKKITAIWCALADAGVVTFRDEASMTKWCAGITKKARLEWAYPAELSLCIESLKQWAKRTGVKLDG